MGRLLKMLKVGLIRRPITDKRKNMRKKVEEKREGPNLIKIAILLMIAVIMLLLTDASMIGLLPFKMNGTILTLINVINFSYIGFILTTLLPDFYMDKEYDIVDKSQYGLLKMARAIHTLTLGIIYATLVTIYTN